MLVVDHTSERDPIELPTARQDPFAPPPELAPLRSEAPLCRLRYPDGHVGWLVTGHRLARAVLTDSRFGVFPDRGPVTDPDEAAEMKAALDSSRAHVAIFLGLDPPDHTRYRRMLTGHFTAERVEAHRARIGEIVAARLDEMEGIGSPLDLVKAFALPIDLATHCLMLGLPESEGEFLRQLDAAVSGKVPPEAVRRLLDEFDDWLRPLVESRRRDPDDGLLSYLVAQPDLDEAQLRSLILFLCVAGVVTSAESLAFGVLALLCHPEQLDAVRSEPELVDPAVDELLRYVTVFSTSGTRRALEDVELDGVTIAAGDCVTVSHAAANRDPEKFENPDVLDVRRSARGHLAFGQGIHTCLGQHLARLEIRVALAALLERFPTLRLGVPVQEIHLYSGFRGTEYSIEELPVAWDRAG
jgi:cytochrome P450